MASIGPGQHQEGEGCQKGFQEEDSIERRGAEGICPASEWHWTLQGEAQKRVRLQNLGGSTMISWRMETCNHRIWNEAQSSCMEIGMAWNSQQQPSTAGLLSIAYFPIPTCVRQNKPATARTIFRLQWRQPLSPKSQNCCIFWFIMFGSFQRRGCSPRWIGSLCCHPSNIYIWPYILYMIYIYIWP